MIRIAAVVHVHLGPGSAGTPRPRLGQLAEQADVVLLAGDPSTCTRASRRLRAAAERLEELPDTARAGARVPLMHHPPSAATSSARASAGPGRFGSRTTSTR